MTSITRYDYERISEYCERTLPYEACGLVAGTIEDSLRIIRRIYFLKNMDKSSSHFSLDPKEQIEVAKDIRACGYELIGCFHSHIGVAAYPSREDVRLANDENMLYIIFSIMGDEREIKGFYIKNDKSIYEEEIIIG